MVELWHVYLPVTSIDKNRSLSKIILTITEAKLVEITDRGALVEKEESKRLIEADTVVLATGATPDKELYEKLKETVSEIYCIGDCVEPRKAIDAIREGMEVALQV